MNGLKLEKVGLAFSSFNAMPAGTSDLKQQYPGDISPLARALTVISNRHGSCSWTLTLPMAHKILFLIIEAMWFMNSIDVAQGSIQVVLMYLTGASLFELS